MENEPKDDGWGVRQINGRTVVFLSLSAVIAASGGAAYTLWSASSEVTRYKARLEVVETVINDLRGDVRDLNRGVTQVIPGLLGEMNVKQAVTEMTLKAILDEIKERRLEDRQRSMEYRQQLRGDLKPPT